MLVATETVVGWLRTTVDMHQEQKFWDRLAPVRHWLESVNLLTRGITMSGSRSLPSRKASHQPTTATLWQELVVTTDKLRWLRAAGICIALDDFGTG